MDLPEIKLDKDKPSKENPSMPNDSETQTTDKKSKETCTDVHQDPENLPVPSADSTDQIEETITTHSASNTKADQPDNHENEKARS